MINTHRLAALCQQRIAEKRREIEGIDALIARETGRANHADL
jgi:hypothetical protein